MYYFTLFKASWCGHCSDFIRYNLPDVENYINQHNDFIKLLIYDADKDSQVIDSQHIEGFPTIRIYQGTPKNPLQKELVEFQRRDSQHIKNVIGGFEQRMKGGKKEHFTPNKTVSYSSYYQNYNGKIKQSSSEVVCENGVCKRKSKIIDEKGRVKKSNDVVPYNDYNGLRNYYDASLEIRNHF